MDALVVLALHLVPENAIVFPEVLEDLSRGVVFDSDPELGVRTRQALIQQAIQPDTAFVSPHFAFPGIFRASESYSGIGLTAWAR